MIREIPPPWVTISPKGFADWMTYTAIWRSWPPLLVASCPVCRSLIADDWQERMGHIDFHVVALFGEAASVHPAPSPSSPAGTGEADGGAG